MLPLKKTFPIIVVLITLSLLGIIAIQVSWIRNAAILRKEQLEQNFVSVVNNVRDEMVRRQAPPIRFKMGGTTLSKGADNSITLERYELNNITVGVSDRFTTDEVQQLIANALRKQKLDTSYEFAIIGKSAFSNDNMIKMQSPRFTNLLETATTDTLDYSIQTAPLVSSLELMNDRTEVLYIILPNNNSLLLRWLGWVIAGCVMFTIIIVTAFALTIRTLLNQKKLSEIKSDFINNMTHELKTPLATISLAIDAIGNQKVMDNREKIRYFSGIIKEENKRMNKQVESILQSALLEKNEIGLNLQVIDVHQVIQHTVDNLQLQLASRDGRVELRLDAINPIIKADDVHFSNVVFNLLDNAIKYSKQHLEVIITTYNTRKSLVITISDNGIGMSRDTISRIFEKFYRAHTGNVHNVKGFGLGLSYVKAIVEAHKGRIKVDSALGRGSKFTLEFPQE
ncbi:sensor histidine kinase [Chitinophaga japonensis]|uniref:histidine kinase n=1 Tax=Chitinophaga japonensis TaxID=104662 RepID=A0A562TBA4_CHIJA|nr:HAMP domain-containing sensor histidine kinase [Chitinophaga japonensis]TWI90859.1 two-component system phosphate regulon sensor histidine kinase PhoR [Chitinophaga japonensis]